jgi:hypothetical protein
MSVPQRLGAAALAAILLTGAAGLVAAAPAGATTGHGAVATPANGTAHPWSTDGCSAAPERGPSWDFHHACIHHDGCYRGHWRSRRTCDGWFLRDMRASCRVLHPSGVVRRWACRGVASVYWAAVRAFGASAYHHRVVGAPVN